MPPAVNLGGHLFTPDQLQKVINETSIPEGKTGALVGTVDSSGAKVAIVMNLKHDWHIETAVTHEWTGDTKAGVKVLHTW